MPPLARRALGRTAGLVGATVDEAPQLPLEPLSEAVNRCDRVEVGDLRPDHRAIQVDLALGPGGALDPRVRFLDEHNSSTEDRDLDESVQRPNLLLRVLARLTRDVSFDRHVYLNHPSTTSLPRRCSASPGSSRGSATDRQTIGRRMAPLGSLSIGDGDILAA